VGDLAVFQIGVRRSGLGALDDLAAHVLTLPTDRRPGHVGQN